MHIHTLQAYKTHSTYTPHTHTDTRTHIHIMHTYHSYTHHTYNIPTKTPHIHITHILYTHHIHIMHTYHALHMHTTHTLNAPHKGLETGAHNPPSLFFCFPFSLLREENTCAVQKTLLSFPTACQILYFLALCVVRLGYVLCACEVHDMYA